MSIAPQAWFFPALRRSATENVRLLRSRAIRSGAAINISPLRGEEASSWNGGDALIRQSEVCPVECIFARCKTCVLRLPY
jgi:hypothetical protein